MKPDFITAGPSPSSYEMNMFNPKSNYINYIHESILHLAYLFFMNTYHYPRQPNFDQISFCFLFQFSYLCVLFCSNFFDKSFYSCFTFSQLFYVFMFIQYRQYYTLAKRLGKASKFCSCQNMNIKRKYA